MPGRLQIGRRLGEVGDDPVDVRLVHLVRWKRIARRADRAWREQRMIAFHADRFAAEMDDLADDCCALRAYRRRAPCECWQDLVVISLDQLAAAPRGVGRDHCRAGDHQPHARSRAVLVISDVVVGRSAVHDHRRAVRQHDDAVAQRDRTDLDRGE